MVLGEELLWFAGCLGNWNQVICHLIDEKAPPFLRNHCSWRPPWLGEARLIPFSSIPWHCPYESSNSLSFARRNSIVPHTLKPVHSYLFCVRWILSRPSYISLTSVLILSYVHPSLRTGRSVEAFCAECISHLPHAC